MRRAWVAVALLLLFGDNVACSRFGRRRPPAVRIGLEIVASPEDRAKGLQQTVETIQRRLGALGVFAEVKAQGNPADGRFVVNLWTTSDLDRLKRIISDNGKLELVHVISYLSPAPAQTYPTKEEAIAALKNHGQIPPNRRVLPYLEPSEIYEHRATSEPGKWVIVETPAIIDGHDLRTARAVPSVLRSDEYEIFFTLKKESAERFGGWTGSNLREYLGVVLNDEVKSIA
jgi:preprotein translocase subunit SecD